MREVIIRVEHIHKFFGKKHVLQDISLEICRGEIYGILGPSGCGKTTLIKLISGMLAASSGKVTVLEQPMPSRKVLRQIGYMAQSDALYLDLSARENLQFFGKVYGIPPKQLQQRICETMQTMNLLQDLDTPVKSYSGGMKRRLSLAGTLLHQPTVIILDEPTVGIDPLLRQRIWQELHQLASTGTTIILTTHVMDEAAKCSRLAMMRDGCIIAQGAPDELLRQTGTASIEEAFIFYGGGGHAHSGSDAAYPAPAET
ncbi:MAG: ABC transporter ATP-binding protein [Peptococcaceae bacterium]